MTDLLALAVCVQIQNQIAGVIGAIEQPVHEHQTLRGRLRLAEPIAPRHEEARRFRGRRELAAEEMAAALQDVAGRLQRQRQPIPDGLELVRREDRRWRR